MKKKSWKRICILIKKIIIFIRGFTKRCWGWLITNHDGLQVFLTIGAILLAFFLWLETRRQVNVSSNTLKFQRESDSTHTVNQARKDSINEKSQIFRDSLALENFRIENRAYLVITVRQKDIIHFSVNKPDTIRWSINNVGKTPSYKTKYIFYVTDYPIEEKIFEAFYTPVSVDGNTIGPGIPSSHESLTFPYDETLSSSLKSGIKNLYFAILVSYNDIFHRPHHVSIYMCIDKNKWSEMPAHNKGD
jgi:hypothetical protein